MTEVRGKVNKVKCTDHDHDLGGGGGGAEGAERNFGWGWETLEQSPSSVRNPADSVVV